LRPAQGHKPERRGQGPRRGVDERERACDLRGLRCDRGRHGQLPDPLPGERRVRPAWQAQRLRLHLPLRGPGKRVLRRGRPLLPLPLPRAASSRPRPQLRRGRGARHTSRRHRDHPGHRDRQAHTRDRRAAHRTAPPLRRFGHELSGDEAAQGPGLPRLRREPYCYGAHRLPGILRYSPGQRRRRGERRAGDHGKRSQEQARQRRGHQRARRARAARVRGRQHRREAHTPRRAPAAPGRVGSGRVLRGPLQDRGAQRQGRETAAGRRLPERLQRQGRHHRLERGDRPERAEVL
ncbi:Molybdopterin-synthase adenylyltransferase, partial [uncultured Rubrobacteraceae bacterium]